MDTIELAKLIIKLLHDDFLKKGTRFIFNDELEQLLNSANPIKIASAANYIRGKNYAKTTRIVGNKYGIQNYIQAPGIDFMSSTSESTFQSVSQNFNIQNNYGAVGSNQNFTINNSFSFENFEKLIEQNTDPGSKENKEIKELLEELKNIVKHEIPIKKGLFAKFSDLMEEHSWITGAIAQFALSWLTGNIFTNTEP